MERVDHVHIVEVGGCRLVGDVHGVLERQVPDGEGLELRIACFASACMLVVELGEADCHLAAARSGGGNHHERARGLHEIVLAVALLRVDELHIVRVALDGVVVVGGDTQALQALAVGIGGFLPVVVGDDHRGHQESALHELLAQAEHILVVGDAEVLAHFVLLNVERGDDNHYLHRVAQLGEHC